MASPFVGGGQNAARVVCQDRAALSIGGGGVSACLRAERVALCHGTRGAARRDATLRIVHGLAHPHKGRIIAGPVPHPGHEPAPDLVRQWGKILHG